jgi:gliding motility-associated lipoprotein GldH
VEFETEIRDTGSSYDFYVALRHMQQFPLKYVTIDFTFITPSGETRSREHRIDIKDADGKFLGKGMGDLWDIEIPVWLDFTFTEPGICRFEISSSMSYADLPGIMQVGLIIRKAD